MMHLLDGVGLWADIRCERPAEARPVLFVDRDGVLIEDRGYVGSVAETRLYPDAPESVAAARAGTAVDAVFACAYHADGQAPYAIADHFWRKPNPGMILEGLRRLNGTAAHSAMVGDKPGDIAAARAAGLGHAVLVEREASGVAKDCAADAVVRSLGEAVKTLVQSGARQCAP